MIDLPEMVREYRSTPLYNQDTVPAGLLKDHSTKPGTWGLLQVESGRLLYAITEPGFEETIELEEGGIAVIVPEHAHLVEPLGDVEFRVVFYR